MNVGVRKTKPSDCDNRGSGAYIHTSDSWESRYQLYELLILRKPYRSMTSLTVMRVLLVVVVLSSLTEAKGIKVCVCR